ncbi:MAG: 3'-5' exonuclease, partial [Aerococcus urinaeequi]
DRMQTEILLYEEEDGGKSSDYDQEGLDGLEGDVSNGTKMQAELIAQSILDKVNNQHMIYDKKLQADRPITFNDIVILVATRRNHSELEDVFAQYKIPLMLDDSANYFQRTEIRVMLNVLKFIDNPYQDIPLAAILRSPIIGLNEQDLAKIRIANKQATYYDAMKTYMAMDEGQDERLAEKLRILNDWHLAWRDIARDKPLATLIWQIYTDTGFLDYVGGMPNGEIRQDNLHGFYKLASNYEASAFKGIFQFIRFVEKIQEKDNDLQAPKHGDEARSAVHVYTIHHSKGLEFPLVYVYNISKRFNTQDLRNPVIYNDAIGIGVKLSDRTRHITYPNMFEMMAKRFEKKDMLAEEMRKLYVALTRAEQQLVLVGMVKNFDTTIGKWQGLLMKDEQLSPSGRIKANSLLDWIGPALMRHHDFDQVNQSVHIPDYLANTKTNFRVAVVSSEDALAGRSKWVKTVDESNQVDQAELLAAIFSDDKMATSDQANKQVIQLPAADFDYAYQSATKTTSFQSVSELKRMLQDP